MHLIQQCILLICGSNMLGRVDEGKRGMPKFFIGGALSLVVCLAIVVGVSFVYRGWRQHQAAKAATIDAPRGIDEARFITVEGAQQWVTIRGQDRSNPILMLIDGGPGVATSPFIPSPLERNFVVVRWDQPGAGRTYGRAGGLVDSGLTIEKMIRDGLDVADYVRGHLHKEKIGLLATSWGTVVGVGMVKIRPGLFYAYVGSSQIVNMQRGLALS
jgi:proline iminopeptidase